MLETGDVIAAISTPLGEGGIGIVRLSGDGAFEIAESIFIPKKKGAGFPRRNRLYYGHIKNESGENVDEVLVGFMPAPWTYTREDIVEINCHSGMLTLKIILELVLRKGARLAKPGEFTRRAFENGRIDLSQAESVLNLIRSRSEKALKAAASNLGGNLSRILSKIRESIIFLLAEIDAAMDFPDEVEYPVIQNIKEKLEPIFNKVTELYNEAERGVWYQEGMKVTITGKPNVGKSSLLNRLLRKERAIVTDIPGTTRDLLDEFVTIKGIPLHLIDTAGIREPKDLVEHIGVDRSREVIEVSDLVLLLIDASTGIEEEDREIINIIREKEKNTIVAINKIDIMDMSEQIIKNLLPGVSVIKISVKDEKEIDTLEKLIVSMVESEHGDGTESHMVINIRHKEILCQMVEMLSEALNNIDRVPLDLISIDLKIVLNKLGEITGETVSDEALDRIFSNFCIGK